jgi:putative flippase GtrA
MERQVMSTALKYAIFAAISTLFNLGTQRLCFYFHGGQLAIYVAMLCGTFTGLLVKYILDKRYIFYYKTESLKGDLVRFFLYSLMGVFTTLIFWVTELFFDFIFAFDGAKYLGAFTGLFLGYTTKYFLDKRFVFSSAILTPEKKGVSNNHPHEQSTCRGEHRSQKE